MLQTQRAELMIKTNICARPRHYWSASGEATMGELVDSSLCLLWQNQKSQEKLKFNFKEQTTSCLPLVTTASVYSLANTGGELWGAHSSFSSPTCFFLFPWTGCHTLMLTHTHTQGVNTHSNALLRSFLFFTSGEIWNNFILPPLFHFLQLSYSNCSSWSNIILKCNLFLSLNDCCLLLLYLHTVVQ